MNRMFELTVATSIPSTAAELGEVAPVSLVSIHLARDKYS